VAVDVDRFKTLFSVLRDERGLLEPWQKISLDHKVSGKQAHDAHLVAAMHRHGLTHLLTFNIADFKRFSGITILDPEVVARG
jgi:predicted nucleic acid-binding protein